jgi:2'-hydroxyisoflavone reductase
LFEECKEVSGSGADLTWVDAAFLEKHAVRPLSDLPMWSPRAVTRRCQCEEGDREGPDVRPMATTIQDTLEWWKSLPKHAGS